MRLGQAVRRPSRPRADRRRSISTRSTPYSGRRPTCTITRSGERGSWRSSTRAPCTIRWPVLSVRCVCRSFVRPIARCGHWGGTCTTRRRQRGDQATRRQGGHGGNGVRVGWPFSWGHKRQAEPSSGSDCLLQSRGEKPPMHASVTAGGGMVPTDPRGSALCVPDRTHVGSMDTMV